MRFHIKFQISPAFLITILLFFFVSCSSCPDCPENFCPDSSHSADEFSDMLIPENEPDISEYLEEQELSEITAVSCPAELVPPPPLSPLHAENGFISDKSGRKILLRGVNFSGMEEGGTGIFNDKHFEEFQKFGFNAIRLPVGWAGIEPAQGIINEEYLKEIDKIIDLAEKYSMFVLLDMHQWYWAAAGMPDWTCPLKPELSVEYLTGCAEVFFSSPDLIDAFAKVWEVLAGRYKGRSVIAAFDLINEPPPPYWMDALTGEFEEGSLFQFYNLLIDRIRSIDPDRMIFIEPVIASFGQTSLPEFNSANLVYSPHIYILHTYSEEAGLEWLIEPNPDFLESQYDMAVESAARLKMPAAVGEYGVPPYKDGGTGWLLLSGDLQDKFFMGSFYWDACGGWGLLDKNLIINPYYIENLMRPFIAAAAGDVYQMISIPWSGNFYARIFIPENQTCSITEVVLPSIIYPSGPQIAVSENARSLYDPLKQRLYVQALVPYAVIEIMVH
jgi:hypothetical protein